ncbi:MAG: hypothetical protein FWD18_00605 [Micrococcales bacterium]|nr:hypothetical protein [Micrococcales bacterium]
MNTDVLALVAQSTSTTLPTPVVVLLVVVAVVQITLQVTALVVLARTPRERVLMGLRWPWVLIILLVSTVGIGAIVFLAVGRKPAPVDEEAPAVGRDEAVRTVVDELYRDKP